MVDGSPAVTQVTIHKRRGTQFSRQQDCVAVEEPLEIRLGYTDKRKGRLHKSLSITMRTPGNDKELAAGFLFTEGILTGPDQILSVEFKQDNVITMELAEDLRLDLPSLERNFYTTSSCGICGKASLEALSLHGAEVQRDNPFNISGQTLLKLGEALKKQQHLFQETGGIHAAACFNAQGDIIEVREDVGRHNAMDKLLGSLFLNAMLPMEEKGLLVSGRTSFELMQKALMAGCPMLVAVGAPSSLAVELAEEFNISLVGFLNAKTFNIYHGRQHIL